jgi:hypothetical protein
MAILITSLDIVIINQGESHEILRINQVYL